MKPDNHELIEKAYYEIEKIIEANFEIKSGSLIDQFDALRKIAKKLEEYFGGI